MHSLRRTLKTVAGQGTAGLGGEWRRQRLDTMMVAVGGGGLIAGIDGVVRADA